MASHGLHPALDLRLSAGLRQTSLQAAAERFPRNGGVDLHQGIVFGVQSGVAILDIEKAHLSHVALLRPCWLTCFSDSKPRGRWVLLEMPITVRQVSIMHDVGQFLPTVAGSNEDRVLPFFHACTDVLQEVVVFVVLFLDDRDAIVEKR